MNFFSRFSRGVAGRRRLNHEDASLKTPRLEYTSFKMDVCPLTDDQLLDSFMFYVNQTLPALYKRDDGSDKYMPPNFLDGNSKVPHYRLMKILHSMSRATIEADITWWTNRLRVQGIPQTVWMGSILASAQDLLWKSFSIWQSGPAFTPQKRPENLVTAVRRWCECVLNVKTRYFGELRKLAEYEPDLVWSKLEGVPTITAPAQAGKTPSSDEVPPTLPIEDPIMPV